MPTHKKINIAAFPRKGEEPTPEQLYWKSLKHPVTVKEFGAIQCINFSPVEPHYMAISSSAKVQIFDPISSRVIKTITKFKEAAFGAKFRADGQVFCCGGDEGIVRVFDVEKKTCLRYFKGHGNSVRRCDFVDDSHKVVSFSDDKTIKIWDVATESLISTYSEHSDFVRSGCPNPVSPELIFSGSYDHSVKLTDTRVGDCVLTLDTGFPVEDLIVFPSGAYVVTAGGNAVQIWDVLAGGKRVAKLQNHHKTITCLTFTSDHRQFLSGSIDRHVKIYNASSLTLAHTLDYPSPVLSLRVSPGDKVLAVGSVDGYISIRQRVTDEERELEKQKKEENKRKVKITSHMPAREFKPEDGDHVVEKYMGTKIEQYEKCMRMYKFKAALKLVLNGPNINRQPELIVAVLRELIRLGAMKKALVNPEKEMMQNLLRFIHVWLTDRRFTRVLIDVAHDAIDVLSETSFDDTRCIRRYMDNILQRLKQLETFWDSIFELSGAADMVLAIRDVGKGDETVEVEVVDLAEEEETPVEENGEPDLSESRDEKRRSRRENGLKSGGKRRLKPTAEARDADLNFAVNLD